MRKMENKKKGIRKWQIVLLVVVLLLVVSVGVFCTIQWMGKKSLTSHNDMEDVEITVPEHVEIEADGTVIHDGKKYRRNENLISILCMGIDKEELQTEEQLAGENGQADTLLLAVLDTTTGEMKLLNISRDSMVDVELYNVENEYVKTSKMQLCLAYAYGNGKETSCENTKKSVSRLLYGMPIDAYAAIDLSAITVLNDAIGGVEVEVLEDLSSRDKELVKGAHVLLKGRQARTYVRSRDFEGAIDSNNARMARQKQYLMAFIDKALAAAKEDITIPVKLYNEAADYMVTDIDTSEVTYLAQLVLKNGFNMQDIISIPGEVKEGDPYAEYYVDEEALYEIILEVFYTEV